MARKQTVFAETICGRCGIVERREGADASCPPVGWAAVTLIRRDDGSGWTNNTHLIDTHMCPNCTYIVMEAAEPCKSES